MQGAGSHRPGGSAILAPCSERGSGTPDRAGSGTRCPTGRADPARQRIGRGWMGTGVEARAAIGPPSIPRAWAGRSLAQAACRAGNIRAARPGGADGVECARHPRGATAADRIRVPWAVGSLATDARARYDLNRGTRRRYTSARNSGATAVQVERDPGDRWPGERTRAVRRDGSAGRAEHASPGMDARPERPRGLVARASWRGGAGESAGATDVRVRSPLARSGERRPGGNAGKRKGASRDG